MPRKPTGKVTKNDAEVLQKNGDIYIYERKYQYDPKTKKTKRISNKLLSKIPKGTSERVPTRQKRESVGAPLVESLYGNSVGSNIHASRQHTGMIDILNHIGNVSGIDAALLSSTDEGTALKIMSIARFLVATSGDSLPHIETWQLTHPIPYADGITEDIYYKLCKSIGTDETFRQRLFYERCRQLGTHPLIAFDSTTQSTYSENQVDARYGFNKDKDGLKTIKYLTLYSVDNRQPIAFSKQPGNLSDVTSLSNTLKQLDILGIHNPEIVTDNGYYSEENLADMCLGGFRFITFVKTSVTWVRKELDMHIEKMVAIGNRRADLGSIYCHTVTLMHIFKKNRRYASKKKGLNKGSVETFEKRLYLHFYYNPVKKVQENDCLYAEIANLKKMLEEGVQISDMTDTAQKKATKYLIIRKTKGDRIISITYNEEAYKNACRYHGYFALISNREKDRFNALEKYRKREKVEEYFKMAKEDADASSPRVWYADHLMGRMILQFVALSYEDCLRFKIGQIKATLGKKTGDPKHDTKEILALESSLKKWLIDISFSNILRWFDAYETTKVSTVVANRRWNSETTKRDRLFLEKLGMQHT
jgi:hypothetical protein